MLDPAHALGACEVCPGHGTMRGDGWESWSWKWKMGGKLGVLL